MIVKDEEANLENFLKKIKDFVDEIIIVDTGSKDSTKEIAKKFTKKVYDYQWNDDFSKVRNYSIETADKEWILWLDPDENIENLEILKELTENKAFLGWRFIQNTYKDNQLISTRGICKLFQNNKKIKFIYPIHETVRDSIQRLQGRIGKSGILINHHPKLSKEKSDYYLKLLEIKKQQFPESNVDVEIDNENNLFKL
jgi:glycosyltransferase involved in cell wall biosynthesis